MAEITERKKRVEKINNLLKIAFGKNVMGSILTRIPLPIPSPFARADNPLSLYIFGTGWKQMGKLNDDGSEMKTYYKYITQSEKYATLYEKEFGQKPIIVLEEHPLADRDW